jgi:DDE superfamily endonuclease
MLRPFVIFKESCRVEIKVRFLQQMEYGMRQKGWMDENLMLQWIEQVWKPSVTYFEVSYFILDCCTSHVTTAVKEAFDNCNTELVFILKDYTSKLQLIDDGINKPFQTYGWLLT